MKFYIEMTKSNHSYKLLDGPLPDIGAVVTWGTRHDWGAARYEGIVTEHHYDYQEEVPEITVICKEND